MDRRCAEVIVEVILSDREKERKVTAAYFDVTTTRPIQKQLPFAWSVALNSVYYEPVGAYCLQESGPH
jgi:hypothetical protein